MRNRTLLPAAGLLIAATLCTPPASAQDAVTLKGVIDIHVHQNPDSVPRVIDADDLARLAKASGMRGLVLKSHWEPTASLAYMTRKMVPGIELFGGVTQDIAVGGINPEAVKRMAAIKGGWGRVVWLPTFDAANQVKGRGPQVEVSKNGALLPGVLTLIDVIAQNHQLVLETGHVSPAESLMVIREAKARGVTHIVVTHALSPVVGMSIPQMQQAAQMGAFIELVYGATLGPRAGVTLSQYAAAIRAVGAAHMILSSDLGAASPPSEPTQPLEPQGMLDYMNGLHKLGISVADIDLMTKTNPALALGLAP